MEGAAARTFPLLILRRGLVLWGLNLGLAFISSLKGGRTPKMEM